MKTKLLWLARLERKPGEEARIGMILSTGQRCETVELLDLVKSGIRGSSDWTKMMSKEWRQRKLHDAPCG